MTFVILLIASIGVSGLIIFLWRKAVNKTKELERQLSLETNTNIILKNSLKREKALTTRLRNELQKTNKLLEEHVSPAVLFDSLFSGSENSGSS